MKYCNTMDWSVYIPIDELSLSIITIEFKKTDAKNQVKDYD